MFTVSTILAFLFLCLCNDVIMRYMSLHVFTLEKRWKTFIFSIVILWGYSWIAIIYIEKEKV